MTRYLAVDLDVGWRASGRAGGRARRPSPCVVPPTRRSRFLRCFMRPLSVCPSIVRSAFSSLPIGNAMEQKIEIILLATAAGHHRRCHHCDGGGGGGRPPSLVVAMTRPVSVRLIQKLFPARSNNEENSEKATNTTRTM